MDMTTVQHTSSIQSRGITTIICDTDDESEPKTILEIGGISRPIPTYATQHRNPVETVLVSNDNSLSNSGSNWMVERTEIVPSPHRAFSDFQEHKIVRMNNGNWNLNPYKSLVIAKLDNFIESSMYYLPPVNEFLLRRCHMPNVLTWTISMEV